MSTDDFIVPFFLKFSILKRGQISLKSLHIIGQILPLIHNSYINDKKKKI